MNQISESNQQPLFLKINQTVLLGFVILTFIFDFMDKIEIFHGQDFPKLNRHLKIAVIIYSIAFILIKAKFVFEKLKPLIISFIILALTFLLKRTFWNLYLQEFYRYSFIFFFFPPLYYGYLNGDRKAFFKTFYKLFTIIVIANLLAVLAGWLFGVHSFKTYDSNRFGVNGFILSQGVTPYVYLAATMIFWLKRDYWYLTCVFLMSILSGVKGVYVGGFLLVLFLTLFDGEFKKPLKIKIISIGIAAFTLLLLIMFLTPPFNEILREDGLISALFSFRIDNLMEIFNTSDSNEFNIIYGATGLETIRAELQFFDVLLFFGALGILIYAYLFFILFKKVAITNNGRAFMLACLFLSLLSGNLLYIPLAITLYCITILCVVSFEREWLVESNKK